MNVLHVNICSFVNTHVLADIWMYRRVGDSRFLCTMPVSIPRKSRELRTRCINSHRRWNFSMTRFGVPVVTVLDENRATGNVNDKSMAESLNTNDGLENSRFSHNGISKNSVVASTSWDPSDNCLCRQKPASLFI